MSKLLLALVIVLSINGLMMITQTAVLGIDSDNIFYTGEGGIIEQHNIDGSNPYDELPGQGASVEDEQGDIFTDIVGSMISWLGQKTGFDTLIQTLSAPYNYLKAMGLPPDFANIIGTMWYIMTLTLLILVIFGRHT